jgi:hypothetical protein
MAIRKIKNGCLKIAGSLHNFFHCHHRVVLPVDPIVYYNLAKDIIGPPQWPVELHGNV